jgi:hypothetical protein
MIGRYKFLRMSSKTAAFADVTVHSMPAEVASIRWRDELTFLRNVYGEATESGVTQAQEEYRRRGGAQQLVEIVEVVWTASDTSPNSMQVAATIAAWKSWGGTEADVNIVRQGNQWRAVFI